MFTPLNLKLTQAGSVASWNATNTGIVQVLTHIQLGSGNRTPTGEETHLIDPQQSITIGGGFDVSPTQKRIAGVFSGTQSYPISEVGIWSGAPDAAGSTLIYYWSRAAGFLAYKGEGANFIFEHTLAFSDASSNNFTIVVDESQSAMLSMLYVHEQRDDPHKQYMPRATTQITDWHAITESGNYMAADAANQPPRNGWWIGTAVAHSADWITVEVYQFTVDDSSNSIRYKCEKNGGTWGAWYPLLEALHEMDARYVVSNRGAFPTADGQDFDSIKLAGEYAIHTPNFTNILHAPFNDYGVMKVYETNSFHAQVVHGHGNAPTMYRVWYADSVPPQWIKLTTNKELDALNASVSAALSARAPLASPIFSDGLIALQKPSGLNGHVILDASNRWFRIYDQSNARGLFKDLTTCGTQDEIATTADVTSMLQYVDISRQDLNNYKQTARVKGDGLVNSPNPAAGMWWVVDVSQMQNGWTVQRAITGANGEYGKAYIRHYTADSTWTAWVAQATETFTNTLVNNAVNALRPRVGDIGMTHALTPPPNTIFWTNSPLSRTAYASLFALYGDVHGGDGATTFCLPAIYDGDVMWAAVTASLSRTPSAGQNLSHTHSASTDAGGAHQHTYSGWGGGGMGPIANTNGAPPRMGEEYTGVAGQHSHSITVFANGGSRNKAAGLGARFYVYYQ